MPNRLFGVLGNECLELAFGTLMVEKGAARRAEERRKLGPGVRRAHIHDPDRLDSRSRRLGIDGVRRFTGLDAAPKLLLSGYQHAEIKWIHRDGNFHPLAATGDDRQN